MFVSVILCTYRRAEDLARLLECLAAQTHSDFEILVVDGSAEDRSVRDRVEALLLGGNRLRLLASPPGLTRQRNIGLDNARGDLLCFLDDDVTVGADFLAQVVDLLAQPGMEAVGGLSGYNTLLEAPPTTTLRWRLRRWLGTVPTLDPGGVDHLGRNAPLSFLRPFSGSRDVGWLPGCCMIYRREAVSAVSFDEGLPLYGGEDRDFSMQVGQRWRLVMCGDLHFQHHVSPRNRVSDVERVFQVGFGMGRGLAKRARGVKDHLRLANYVAGEFVVDMLAFLASPTPGRFRLAFARAAGFLKGFRSLSHAPDGPAIVPNEQG